MKISRREKRFLIGGGLALASLLTGVYVVEPVVASQLQVREEIQQKSALLEQHLLLAAEHERYHRKAEELKASLQRAEEEHFRGDKAPVVAAEIQGLLHAAGEEAGITFVRENVPAPKKADRFTQVIVELSIRGDIRAIRDFLHKVHASPKLLTIPRITVRGGQVRGQAPLLADLQVAGHMIGEEETSPSSAPSVKENGSRVGTTESGRARRQSK